MITPFMFAAICMLTLGLNKTRSSDWLANQNWVPFGKGEQYTCHHKH